MRNQAGSRGCDVPESATRGVTERIEENYGAMLAVLKLSVFAFNNQLIALVCSMARSDNAGLKPEFLSNGNDIIGKFGENVNLKTVSHVEYPVHFVPWCLGFGLNDTEKGWYVEKVILNHQQVIYKVQNFGLPSSCAVDHAVDNWPVVG